MALGSQSSRVDTLTTGASSTGLTHDIFVGDVVKNVRRESPIAQLFMDAQAGPDYRLEGQNMVFAADLRFVTGAVASDGKIPDHVGMDAIQGKLTPVRRYRRIALDNHVEKRASGPGAFEDLAGRVFDQLWDSWKNMEIRQSIGASSGTVALCSSRTSSTVVVLKDGYANTGTNPIMHLSEGAIIAWYDVSAAQIGGAAKVSSINYSTNTVTVDAAQTWETDVGNQIAAGDYILFATTNGTTRDYFVSEKDIAPNGLSTIVDPGAAATTVFNISESTYPRWKPYRKTSATFDHLEVSEFKRQLGIKRGFGWNPGEDTLAAHPALAAQLARTLMGFQQQAYTGGDLAGGYGRVTIDGAPITEDPFLHHNVLFSLHRPSLFRVNLGEDADLWGEDGSQWSRIADFDGKEAFAVDYMNYFSPSRGFHGAVTSITTTEITDTEFDAVPNY